MSEQTKPEVKLSFEEQCALAKKVPSVQSLYNRISIEHDIPLSVAEAMVRFAGIFVIQMIQSKNDERELYGLSGLFASMWIGMAGALNVPEERMKSAVRDAINGAIIVAKEADKAVEVHLRERGEKVAA